MRKLVFSFSKFDPRVNYYQILGVSRTANQNEIKQQYYKLAKLYHPDVSKNNIEKFKTINDAYQVLSDDTIKSEYDSSTQVQNQRQTSTNSQSYPKQESYNYGYSKQQWEFKQQYEEFRQKQHQQYQYEKEQEERMHMRMRGSESASNPALYVNFMGLFILGMFSYILIDIITAFHNNRNIILYDESTGRTIVTTPGQLAQMQRRQPVQVDESRVEALRAQHKELRRRRQEEIQK